MIRVKIFKNGVQTNEANFPSLLEAQAWVDDNVANNSWGKHERWLKEQQCLDEGIDFSSLETRISNDGENDFTEYKVPSEYLVETSDVSAEYQDHLLEQESEDAYQLVNALKVQVRKINVKKLKTGVWDSAKWSEFKADPTINLLMKAIDTASFKDAKALVLTMNESLYEVHEKQAIVAMIDAHLTKWS